MIKFLNKVVKLFETNSPFTSSEVLFMFGFALLLFSLMV